MLYSSLDPLSLSGSPRRTGGPKGDSAAGLTVFEKLSNSRQCIRRESLVLEQAERVGVVQREPIALNQRALVPLVRVPGVGEDVMAQRYEFSLEAIIGLTEP